jgi:CBS domain-containing protein
LKLTDTIRCVMQTKKQLIWYTTPDTTVYEALEVMAEREIGALLVISNGRLAGVVSERDYARKVILLGKSSKDTTVAEIMRSPDNVVSIDHTIDDCMRLMTASRARHLPVMDGARVAGVISIGDLVNWVISAQEETINQLHAYVAGAYPG